MREAWAGSTTRPPVRSGPTPLLAKPMLGALTTTPIEPAGSSDVYQPRQRTQASRHRATTRLMPCALYTDVRRAGFSLAELVMSLAIIGIIAAIAAPRYTSSLSRYRV